MVKRKPVDGGIQKSPDTSENQQETKGTGTVKTSYDLSIRHLTGSHTDYKRVLISPRYLKTFLMVHPFHGKSDVIQSSIFL